MKNIKKELDKKINEGWEDFILPYDVEDLEYIKEDSVIISKEVDDYLKGKLDESLTYEMNVDVENKTLGFRLFKKF